jgi:inorganic pyrophosphatase
MNKTHNKDGRYGLAESDKIQWMQSACDFLGKFVTVWVDRPFGSRHPRYGFLYPVNYGFVPDILSGDGEELDAYILGIDSPLMEFNGLCIAVLHRLDDDDDKLIVVPPGVMLSDAEIRAQTHFQEQFFCSVLLREKK